ncbi:MAG: FAD-binding protein [Candidatus Aminicenantes bacterium]|nr:FAD-binding protein [Candidatus Aminicenantes bacterium]
MEQKEIQQIQTDVLIIGSGQAGLTAGLYCARYGLKTIVLQGKGASRLYLDYQVENYPGFVSIQSGELLAKFKEHAQLFGAEFLEADAIDVNLSMDPKFVATREHLIEAGAVIIATGRMSGKKKMIPGEETFVGMGVSYCATCDGPLYRGRKILAIGNDEEAAEDVMALSQMGVEVRWLTGDGKPLQVSEKIDADLAKNNISAESDTIVSSIHGQGRVEKVVIEEKGEERDLMVDGVFIFREMPLSFLFGRSELGFDHRQCLITDGSQKTNLEGVFAAGDITCGGMQIVTAAGEGARAAMAVLKYLRKKD